MSSSPSKIPPVESGPNNQKSEREEALLKASFTIKDGEAEGNGRSDFRKFKDGVINDLREGHRPTRESRGQAEEEIQYCSG